MSAKGCNDHINYVFPIQTAYCSPSTLFNKHLSWGAEGEGDLGHKCNEYLHSTDKDIEV